MYDIGIPEIIITERLEDDKHRSIKYMAQAAQRPSCPNPDCSRHAKPYRHDSTQYLLHDVKSEGKLVYIDLRMQRYKCPECQSVFPDEFTFFTKRQHMTRRLKKEFVGRCIKGETFRYIANDYSVDSKTVSAAFQEYVDAHRAELERSYTPEVLGIDEAHIDDHYRLILTDIKEQRLLDMKPDNSLRTVKSYLRTLDRTRCRCVTMDFAPAYASAVSAILPDALIVIDKFHAVQEVNRCLDNLRKRVQREHLAAGENIRQFKHSRNLFMSNWEDLSPKGETALSNWFNRIPEFYEGYMCKEMFRDIFNMAKTKDKAADMFDKWLSAVPGFPEFDAMKKTMAKRRDHILNYWEYGWTNAYTESVNNAIKAIEKRGRGYKFSRLREMCILEINSPKGEKFDPRTASYSPVTREQEVKKERLYIKGAEFATPSLSRFLPKKKATAPIADYFEIYTSLNARDDFIARMKTYYKALAERSLIS